MDDIDAMVVGTTPPDTVGEIEKSVSPPPLKFQTAVVSPGKPVEAQKVLNKLRASHTFPLDADQVTETTIEGSSPQEGTQPISPTPKPSRVGKFLKKLRFQ